MSTRTQNLGLFKYDTVNDSELPFSIDEALNNNWDILDQNIGSRNIGEIVASTIPLTDAGLHLLDGSLIQGDGIYSAFVSYISNLLLDYSTLFTTETNWQESVAEYGVCGKFVYDNANNTVRLPKITGIIEGTTDLTALGDLIEAGLPNITGEISNFWSQGYVASATSALTSVGGGNDKKGATGSNNTYTIRFDASRSNSIYGNSLTVQPQTIKVLYYIVIATSTKTDIQVDIDEIASNLNGKADRDLTNTNPSSSFATLLNTAGIRTVVETYVNGTSWYRVYSDGWCEQGGFATANGFITFLKPFLNNNFIFTATRHYNSKTSAKSSDGADANHNTVATSTQYGSTDGTGVYIETTTENGSNGKCWQACGYIR